MRHLHFTKSELLDIRSVLERSIQRAELRRRAYPDDPSIDAEAKALADAIADLNDELAGRA